MQKRGTPRKKKYYSPKRRAVYALGDDIDPLVLFNMHGWTCVLCRQKINRRHRLPNYNAATVEHLVPLALGGTHTWDNVSVSHARCNFAKADALTA